MSPSSPPSQPSPSSSYADKKDDLFPMHGGCACGHVRYELRLPPILVHCCHCTDCQRQLGSAFAINAIVETDALVLVSDPVSAPRGRGGGDGNNKTAEDPEPPQAQPAGLLPDFARLTLATPCHGTETGTTASTHTHEQGDKPAEKLQEEDGDTCGASPPIGRPSLVTVPTASHIGQTIACCPRCHTGLWNHYADAGPCLAYLRVGTLDRAADVDPDVHIFTRSRRAFVALADGKPQFEDYYEDRAAFYRPDVLERVAALEERKAAYRASLKAALGQ
ncbi:glutathione-dependent formaldehyde-activating [Purpureocillium lilacinum]|nr:glutathione-dependent formaldehyde-activating [Purpureocillium lilacinum]OAQ81705.1 glutathione-dependent formaldehyde-activating [Purpureocillium lilacinum]OAQ91751.1 glutathione-dependent formaldehyde-activating [Purpureocillium lilacinum]